ncbi:MAG: MtrB/PioB family decaheme-associated outer membrane protein [Betaproteobacteria bacterium]|nr:MtrB/PioB family decaheme-associated outer membrane protein [Betaproteobacteria bacterium]
MKQKISAPLRRRTVVIAVGAALAALAATPSLADTMLTARLFRDSDVLFRDADMARWSDNYIELGVGYNSHDSYRFGQFSGLTDKGGFPLAGFNWLSRDEANDAQYWQVYGSTLGLDSRKLSAEGGIQGKWTASINYDRITRSQWDTTSFIHDGLGSNNLTLPSTFVATLGADDTAKINPRLRGYNIEQERDIYRVGLAGFLGKEWDFKVNYREDHRDGTRLTGLPYNFGGGRAVIVPYEIDDRTRQMEAILSYTTRVAQLQVGYTYSKFDNDLNSFNVRNPFTNTAGQTEGRMSLAPSNDFHQVYANAGYNYSKNTRLTGKLSYSIARQDENFLPYSANLATGAAGNVPPRTSLDGKVVRSLLEVALTTKPMDKMNLKVAYQYNDSDNQTPVANYTYLSRDATTSSTTTMRRNAPLSTTEQKFSVDGDYEIAAKTILRAGLERKNLKYSMDDKLYQNPADRDYTNTDKASIELRRPVSDEFLGSVGYTYTQRRGSEYDKNNYFENTYWNPTFRSQNRLTAHPSMRALLYANYNEDRVRTSGNWTASETVSLQGAVDNYRRKAKGPNCSTVVDPAIPATLSATLPDTCLGQTLAEGVSVSLDVQWQPAENLTTFAFGNYGETETTQKGRTWVRGAATTLVGNTAGNLNNGWSADVLNRDATIGVGLKWQPEERWDVGGTYVYNYGTGLSSVRTGTGIVPAETSMPENWNRLNTLQLFAKWDYSKQLSWRFNYLYENLQSRDWAYDNLTATSIDQVLLTGQNSPRYSNHVFGVSAVVKSW